MGEPPENIIPWTWPFADGDDGGGPRSPDWLGGRGSRRSDMPVIVFASLEEGSGKTMLAAHLAVQAELQGAGPAVAIDTEVSGSLGRWWKTRGDERPAFALSFASRFGEDLNRFQELGMKFCTVDTARAASEQVERIIERADFVVVPVRPELSSMRLARETLDLVDSSRTDAVFLVTAAEPAGQETVKRERVAKLALSNLPREGLAPVTIHRNKAFADAMKAGRTVMETDPDGQPAAEIGQLWDHIVECTRLHAE